MRTGELNPPPYPEATPAHPKPRRWSRIIRDAILEGQWGAAASLGNTPQLAFPVVQDLQNGTEKWEPHDWKILQQARITISNYGLKSEATRQIVSWIFSADLICPYDCQNLMRLLLTPTKFLLWESSWQQRAMQEAAQRQIQGDPLLGSPQKCSLGVDNLPL